MVARWEPLPETLDDSARRLAVHLRRAKDRSGLSVPALAARTASSTGAWERYFNGTQIPPRDAVEALGQLSGADDDRLIALWETADRAAAATAADTAAEAVADPAADPAADTGKGFAHVDALAPLASVQGPRHALRRRRRTLPAVAVGLALGTVFALLVAAEVATDGRGRAGTPLSARPAATAPVGPAPSAASASAAAPGPAGSAVTSRSRPASPAGTTDAAASRTANAVSPDAGRPTTRVPGAEGPPPALGSAPHTAEPGGAPAMGGTTATPPGGAAPATPQAPPPPATSVPVAPTRAPTPSASPSRSPDKGHCLRLIIVGICLG